MSKYDMTFNPLSVYTLSERLYQLYNQYGRNRITFEQFIALYLENKLDDYVEKVRKENECK